MEDAVVVSGSSFMEWWGGYAEVAGMGKGALSMPCIRVYPDGRFEATLLGNQGAPVGKIAPLKRKGKDNVR